MDNPVVHCAHDKMVPIEELRPNPRNPNTHPEKQLGLLGRILVSNGWRAPITVSTRSGMIVRGHGRYQAAMLAQFTEAPVDFQDYATEKEEWEDLLADNKIAELSQIDESILRGILRDFDLDVELAAFDRDYVEELLARDDAEDLKEAIVTEAEYIEARNTADRILEILTEKVRRLAEEDPVRLNGALAVVLQKGRGNAVLFLADPNTADAVAELRRLAEAGDHSPLDTLFQEGRPLA